MKTLKNQLITDYTTEAAHYTMRAAGVDNQVPASEVWNACARGRDFIPASEVATYCRDVVKRLKAGEDPELFNY